MAARRAPRASLAAVGERFLRGLNWLLTLSSWVSPIGGDLSTVVGFGGVVSGGDQWFWGPTLIIRRRCLIRRR